MKGLKATSIAKKKLDIEYIVSLLIQFLIAEVRILTICNFLRFFGGLRSTKKRKADVDVTKKGSAKKKDSGAPKRPLTAFLLFMYIVLLFQIVNSSSIFSLYFPAFLIFFVLVFFYLFDVVSVIAINLWYTGVISAKITRRIFLITNLWLL